MAAPRRAVTWEARRASRLALFERRGLLTRCGRRLVAATMVGEDRGKGGEAHTYYEWWRARRRRRDDESLRATERVSGAARTGSSEHVPSSGGADEARGARKAAH